MKRLAVKCGGGTLEPKGDKRKLTELRGCSSLMAEEQLVFKVN